MVVIKHNVKIINACFLHKLTGNLFRLLSGDTALFSSSLSPLTVLRSSHMHKENVAFLAFHVLHFYGFI